MIQNEYLNVYDLTLKVKSPVFVGSGAVTQKFEYIYDNKQSEVAFIDNNKLFGLLVSTGKTDEYEKYVLNSSRQDLYSFLKTVCGYSEKQIQSLCRYRVSAKDALDENHSFKEIHSFMRNPNGQAYIPGSSLKGALRTVILFSLIRKDGKKGDRSEFRKDTTPFPEGKYLHTLKCKLDRTGKPTDDPINSIMRGVSVSDSDTIPDSAMILAKKVDVKENGATNSVGTVVRESGRPGTEIHFKLTLDRSILKDTITAQTIMENIREFDEFYKQTYLDYFDKPENDMDIPLHNSIVFGGGTGFFAKTLDYVYLNENDAVDYVAYYMSRTFKKHYHENDTDISPHTLKYTLIRDSFYQLGICEVVLS